MTDNCFRSGISGHECGNAEKSYLGRRSLFFWKDKIPSLKEKVKIFGKSEVEIGVLIHHSLGYTWTLGGVYRVSSNEKKMVKE